MNHDAPAPAVASSSTGGPLMPAGHRLDSLNVRPADNGFTVNHTTKKEKPSKKDGYDSTYKEHSRVFEGHQGALRHVGNVLRAATRGSSGKRFSRGR